MLLYLAIERLVSYNLYPGKLFDQWQGMRTANTAVIFPKQHGGKRERKESDFISNEIQHRASGGTGTGQGITQAR